MPPEVLAPAGDRLCMEAAVRSGADAVYFGLRSFSARARAANFELQELESALQYLHRHGRRGYVTLNTLLFDSDWAEFETAVRACAEAGADAVIVQDLGALRLIREIAPTLRVHASTQMTCADPAAVEFARQQGVSRVVLPRELSLAEIGTMAGATAVELEVFVHGALCISYSGQCLASEAFGGRSANRGACAQACRLPYDLVVDGVRVPTNDKAYLLSPQDLEASRWVPELIALGIRALKIEGRLKPPNYVAATTRLYREAVDACAHGSPQPREEVRRTALQTFSRGSGPGFLGGINHQELVEGRGCDHRGEHLGQVNSVQRHQGKDWLHIELRAGVQVALGDGILVEGGREGVGEFGGRIWGLRCMGQDRESVTGEDSAMIWLGPGRARPSPVHGTHRLFKTSDPSREHRIRELVESDARRIPLELELSGIVGQCAVLRGRSGDGREAESALDAPTEAADREGTAQETLREKLGRLGGTQFELSRLAVDLPDNARIPVSALNRARRSIVEKLDAAARRQHSTTDVTSRSLVAQQELPTTPRVQPGLIVLCRTPAQAAAAISAGADGLVLELLHDQDISSLLRQIRTQSPIPVILATSRIRKPGEHAEDEALLDLRPEGLLIRNLGALQTLVAPARELGIPSILDFSLNVTNALSAAVFLRCGAAAFTPAYDLDAQQLLTLLSGTLGPYAEVAIHHPMPLFHMDHCLFAAQLSVGKDRQSCGRPCTRYSLSLRDRTQRDHPVIADARCRNTVFHASPQTACEQISALRAAGVGRFRLELVREESSEVEQLVSFYKDVMEGRLPPSAIFASLGKSVCREVVRGSLRVV